MSCSVRIQTGAKEPIEVMVLDTYGDPLTGKSDVVVKIRRQSDDFVYDWSDDEFKPPVSVASLSYPLVEVDSVNSPGEYRLDKAGHDNGFDTSTIVNPVNNDTYTITVTEDVANDAANLPAVGEIKVGQFVDEIPDFSDDEKTEIKTVLGITGTGTPDDSPTAGVLSLVLGLVQNNFFLDSTLYNDQGLLVGGRIRIFPTKSDTNLATDGGSGEGELATFSIVTEPEASPNEAFAKTYKVTREP
jgi:hypothetical protein